MEWDHEPQGRYPPLEPSSSCGVKILLPFAALLCVPQGLLDFAFSPAFATNNFFYVSYTVEDDEVSRVCETFPHELSAGSYPVVNGHHPVLGAKLTKKVRR